MSTTDDALEVKREVAAELMALPGVHAVGFGTKEVDGSTVRGLAIRVYVGRKRPLADIPPEERIPPRIHGVDTDVIEEEPPTLEDCFPAACDNPNPPACPNENLDVRFYRPLRGGISIQGDVMPDAETGFGRDLEGRHQGTLGFIGRSTAAADSGALVAVTAEHLAMASYGTGIEVAQPRFTAASTRDQIVVGTTLRTLPRRPGWDSSGEEIEVADGDAALIRLRDTTPVYPYIEGIGWVAGTKHISADDVEDHGYPIRKRGMRTRLTYGVVVDVDRDNWMPKVPPDAANPEDCPLVTVPNQMRVNGVAPHGVSRCTQPRTDAWANGLRDLNVSRFSCGGDSGSAWVDDCNRIVGLHWASSIATPINVVENGLEVEALTWAHHGDYEWAPGDVPAPPQLPAFMTAP